MYLEKLTIRNFRCFKNYEVDFAPGVTVLFGKNGTGKTTLIHAIHKALSFMMYTECINEKDSKTKKNVVVARNTITNGNPYLKPEGFAREGDLNNTKDPLVEIAAQASLHSESGRILPLAWRMSAYSNKLRLREGEFIDAFRQFYQWHLATDRLPVLAYLSDSFPHKEDRHHAKLKTKISGYRNFGYYNWSSELGNTKEWVERLEKAIREVDRIKRKINTMHEMQDASLSFEKVIHQEEGKIEEYQKEVKAIESVFQRFSHHLIQGKNHIDVVSLGLHIDDDKLCLNTTDGRQVHFRYLPAGYYRLFGIILDIAYRSYILSESKTVDLEGIVIIDEIDLHLHPELEKVVLARLVETFPHKQFIVSTHSPLVLSGIETKTGKNSILQLSVDREKPMSCPDVYGLDYNSVVQEIMTVGASDPELQRLIDRCAYLYHNSYVAQGDALKEVIMARNVLNNEELQKRIDHAIEGLR